MSAYNMVLYVQKFGDDMHTLNYDFFRDAMLPAQLVTIASSIGALKVMTNVRRETYAKAFEELETIVKIGIGRATKYLAACPTYCCVPVSVWGWHHFCWWFVLI